jgi:hypothetical protein
MSNDGGWCGHRLGITYNSVVFGGAMHLTEQPAHGQVSIISHQDGNDVYYKPNPGYIGPDKFNVGVEFLQHRQALQCGREVDLSTYSETQKENARSPGTIKNALARSPAALSPRRIVCLQIDPLPSDQPPEVVSRWESNYRALKSDFTFG